MGPQSGVNISGTSVIGGQQRAYGGGSGSRKYPKMKLTVLNCCVVNRPPSASNRGLAVGTIVAGARGTAIVGVNGLIDPAASRGNFGLNVHGTTGKLFSTLSNEFNHSSQQSIE